MAEIKDKVVTVESLSILHEHNKDTYMPIVDPVGSGTMRMNGNGVFSGGLDVNSLTINSNVKLAPNGDGLEIVFLEGGESSDGGSSSGGQGGNQGTVDGGNADTLDGFHASAFALASHTHDDRYYTESEIDDKLANLVISGGGTINIAVDSELNSSSTNAIQNKVVTAALNNKADSNHTHSYNDLTNKPTIPTIPTSLPANGGNADTVDGFHASDFASVSDVNTLQNLVGTQSVSTQINNALANVSSGKTLTEHLAEETMVLSSYQYGDTLPPAGTVGRIFFLRVSE